MISPKYLLGGLGTHLDELLAPGITRIKLYGGKSFEFGA